MAHASQLLPTPAGPTRAKRRRHRVPVGPLGHVGMIREEALKGAHGLAAL